MRKYYNSQVLKKKHIKYPFVKIGSQYWTAKNFDESVTPQGNVIANVTEKGAVEKITNAADREFSSDTGFWDKSGTTLIQDGVAKINTTSSNALLRSDVFVIGKYYKVKFEIKNYSTGTIRHFGTSGGSYKSANGVYTFIGNADSTGIVFFAYGITLLDIDNVSIQELNWSNSTEIYDGVYAATAGNAAQKEYAALKEAAMWCYYNNDANNGAIYGKLYNWYAAKLLDLDMVTANFGWRIPTSTQFTTLANTLGGTSVAGGKMKATGLDYWITPNTGATNESGFTALGAGERNITGNFTGINEDIWIGAVNKNRINIEYNTAEVNYLEWSERIGFSLRLIKV